MNANTFLRKLEELKRESFASEANVEGHGSVDCRQCSNCVFCEGCERCHRCTYCKQCVSSSQLTHCVRCTSCHQLANSIDCGDCSDSAFLVLCSNLTECAYCFGCVGLLRKDFHILNAPYERSEYFKIVDRLKKEMRLPR